jgi:hypothetical protein
MWDHTKAWKAISGYSVTSNQELWVVFWMLLKSLGHYTNYKNLEIETYEVVYAYVLIIFVTIQETEPKPFVKITCQPRVEF